MCIFNSHVHTTASKDGKSSATDICTAAESLGLRGVAFTDHCEISSFITENAYQCAKASVKSAALLKDQYKNRILVGIGIEIGDGILNPQYTKQILSLADFDIVLASVHVIPFDGRILHLSRIDFSKLSYDIIDKYMTTYFKQLSKTAKNCDLLLI